MHIRPVVSRLGLSDADDFVRLVDANEEHFKAGGLVMLPHTVAGFAHWLDPQDTHSHPDATLRVVYGIRLPSTGEHRALVGYVSLHRTPHRTSLAYALDKAYEGRGIAHAAVVQAFTAFNEDLAAHGLPPASQWQACVLPWNRRSRALLAALGFRRDPELDDALVTLAGGSVQRLLGFRLDSEVADHAA
jgi:RimJ/RimL family protein N-acetyltransferase